MKNYLSKIATIVKEQGLPVIKIAQETETTDADLTLTPTVSIQVSSPTEFCVVEVVLDNFEPAWKFSQVVDLLTAIDLAKQALQSGAIPAPHCPKCQWILSDLYEEGGTVLSGFCGFCDSHVNVGQ